MTEERTLTLKSGRLAYVIVELRCPDCGMMVSRKTLMHGSLGGKFCNGRGAGRERVKVLTTSQPTERQQQQIAKYHNGHPEYHPLLKWVRATTDERREALTT